MKNEIYEELYIFLECFAQILRGISIMLFLTGIFLISGFLSLTFIIPFLYVFITKKIRKKESTGIITKISYLSMIISLAYLGNIKRKIQSYD